MFRKISEDLNLQSFYEEKQVKTRYTNQIAQYTHLCCVNKTDMHTKHFEITQLSTNLFVLVQYLKEKFNTSAASPYGL